MPHPFPLIPIPSPLPPHPRLLARTEDWERIRGLIETDAVSAEIYDALLNKARQLLVCPLLQRKLEGFRLLPVSRQALERISLLSLVARVSGDRRFARRAVEEMMQVAAFSDWNPSHYLDTAEMALAIAIGYDWLHEFLTDRDRRRIAAAIREKGIAPSLSEPEQWFIRGNNNWNQVCHAGVSAAAIAIAEFEPDLCRLILNRATSNLPVAAAAYAPDGAYPEGPMYWNYGTSFHVVLAAALERLCGAACGIDTYPGFAESAEYIAQMTMPSGEFYPYADCRRTRHLLIPLFWLARRFERPDWLNDDLCRIAHFMDLYKTSRHDDDNYRLLALALLWRQPATNRAEPPVRSRHWLGRGPMPVAAHRSRFGSQTALYAALKGGSPSLNHAHMDVGSFAIHSEGIEWAIDLGMQEYDSLESAGIDLWDASADGMRWKVFRLGPDGHNILRFNGAPQSVNGNGQFIRFQSGGPNPHSVVDLSSLYPGPVAGVRRGLMFLENSAILLQDEWTTGDQPVDVDWQMLTAAQVDIDSREILLRQSGMQLRLLLLDPLAIETACVETRFLERPFDTPNPDVRRITIRVRTQAHSQSSLRVLFQPGACKAAPALPRKSTLLWSDPVAL